MVVQEGKTKRTDSKEMNKNSIKKQMWQNEHRKYEHFETTKIIKKICNLEEC